MLEIDTTLFLEYKRDSQKSVKGESLGFHGNAAYWHCCEEMLGHKAMVP